jgi:hypothetical protein
MKQFIRQNTFETNSSSQHSVAIVETDEKFTEEEIRDSFYIYCDANKKDYMEKPFTVNFSNNNDWDDCGCLTFERAPFKVLATYCDKLRYVIAAKKWGNVEEILDEVKEKHPYILGFKFSMDKYRTDEIDYGTIDHQSSGLLLDFLLKYGLTIEEFLTSKRYVILVDGDEYTTTQDLFKSGLCKFTKIVDYWDLREEDDE